MEYPTYLIHYGVPGQKWGERKYQNEDGTWTEEGLRRRREQFVSETKETAHKVAGIISGHYGDKDIDPNDMKKLVNKYKNYEGIKNKDGSYSEKFKDLVRKNNKHPDSDKSKEGQKIYDWERFEENIVRDPKDLFSEKAQRKARVMDVYKISEEEAETKLEDINRKIRNYKKAIETYLNSSEVKKSMKELNVELKDIYNENDYTSSQNQENRLKYMNAKIVKKTDNVEDINERLKKFRMQYGY